VLLALILGALWPAIHIRCLAAAQGTDLETGYLTNQLKTCFTQPSSLSLTGLLVDVSLDKMP